MILTVCANPSVDSFWSVDQLNKGTTNRSLNEIYYPGGKGIHTALALNELGEEVATLGFWGEQTGRWLKDECKTKRIETIGPVVEPWNRICITLRADSSWDETELLGHGPYASEAEAVEFEAIYERFLATNDLKAVLISGSVPGGFSDDLYARMIAKGKKNETPTFIDASAGLLEKSLEARPRGIHINRHEGKDVCGKYDPVDIAKWLNNYTTLAAVSAGADGLYLGFEGNIYHGYYTITADKIYSTIGAGDCLLAGLVLANLSSKDPEHWTRFAAACGSANCIYPQLGMLKAKDVEEIVDQVTLKKI